MMKVTQQATIDREICGLGARGAHFVRQNHNIESRVFGSQPNIYILRRGCIVLRHAVHMERAATVTGLIFHCAKKRRAANGLFFCRRLDCLLFVPRTCSGAQFHGAHHQMCQNETAVNAKRSKVA